MHELSIAMSLIDTATEQLEAHGATAATRLHLRLGPLSGVVRDALASAYELARDGTPLADAELVIEEVAITARCPACAGARPVVSMQRMRCAVCDTPVREVVTGRELELTSMEIIDND